MRIAPAALTVLLAAAAGEARAAGLQVAVLYDEGLCERVEDRCFVSERMREELRGFEHAILARDPTADFAIVTTSTIVRKFGGPTRRIDALIAKAVAGDEDARWTRYGGGVGRVRRAFEELKWDPKRSKHIVHIGRYGSFSLHDRSAPEELMHTLEASGIIFHALELVEPCDGWCLFSKDWAESASSDLEAFLSEPTWPLGRVPSRVRHVTLISGGYYALALLPFPIENIAWAKENVLKRAFGPATLGHDALADLASGARRPSEIQQEELPEELRGLDLEPLLDPVFDFVDARRVFAEAWLDWVFRANARGEKRRNFGAELGRRVPAPRRLSPSRR